jgi:DNA recombination protein RmuC
MTFATAAWVAVLVLAVGLAVIAGLLAGAARRNRDQGEETQAALAALRAQLGAIHGANRADGERLEREVRQAVESASSAVRLELGARVAELQSALGLQVNQTASDLRATLEQRLQALQQGNEARLEQIRATVAEKLEVTLETRLGESFRQVSERLEQVYRGLGEMQALAAGVGDLKRVLTNVKSRGVFGEVQLAALLEQVLLPDQFAVNVATRPGSAERVDFAVRMPGRGDAASVWLPIDAKFPLEDYERLLIAQESGERGLADDAGRAIERAIRVQARTIRDKYIESPETTDFAILFVPSEGLFAEILRRPGLTEALNRDERIVVAGPTTLFAMLNALQMGFRSLAIERRSAEVWQVLGAVKTEFGKFGEVLAAVRRNLQQASNSIDNAETRTRQMARRLKEVEALPADHAARLLPDALVADAGDGAVEEG